MFNYKDIESVVEAKHNEMHSKRIYRTTDLQQVYIDSARDSMKSFIACLESTSIPKYIRLAKFLREIGYVNIDYEKAYVLNESHYDKHHIDVKLRRKKIVTVYKEFKKIEARKKIIDIKNALKLSKYKDVKDFMDRDFSNIISYLRSKEFFNYNPEQLTKYFDSCTELKFLDSSKLTKHVR